MNNTQDVQNSLLEQTKQNISSNLLRSDEERFGLIDTSSIDRVKGGIEMINQISPVYDDSKSRALSKFKATA